MTYADPWVLQGLMGRDALGRVDGQHLVDEVFGFRSNGVPLRGWELQRPWRGGETQGAAVPTLHAGAHSHHTPQP